MPDARCARGLVDRPALEQHVAGGRTLRPAIVRSSVDLPAPLAPMMATVSPWSTLNETLNSAWKSP